MPLYRYECKSCGSQFTVLVRQQAQADAPVCPDCGSKETRRMVPRVAVQFKGSGYYKTDYARKGKAGSARGKVSNNPDSENHTESSVGNDSQTRESHGSESRGLKKEHKSEISSAPAKTASSE